MRYDPEQTLNHFLSHTRGDSIALHLWVASLVSTRLLVSCAKRNYN
jgi:hypothetical protein